MTDQPVGYDISSGPYTAAIAATGAGLRGLWHEDSALTETWELGTKPPLSAGLVLAPWPNRVGGGSYRFGGEAHQLEITEPARGNASHGLVRRLDWQLVEQTPTAVEQSILIEPQQGWPYPLRLTARHELTEDGLVVSHTAQNVGERRAPWGLGLHTFVRVGDVPLDQCQLTLAAEAWQPVDPQRLLPVGPPEPVAGTAYDFTRPRTLASTWLDTPFTSLRHDAGGFARHSLRAPSGDTTELWTDHHFRWAQAFTADPSRGQGYPGRGRALAVEPMTCPGNALGSGVDLVVIEPAQTWSARWGMRRTSAS